MEPKPIIIIDPAMHHKGQLILDAKNGNLLEIKTFVARGIDPTAGDNTAIIQASVNGHLEVVRYLATLPRVDPAARRNEAIIAAIIHSHLPVVQYLVGLPGVDPGARNNAGIILTAAKKNWNMVRYLASLQGFDLLGSNQYLFYWATSKGLLGLMQLILESFRDVEPWADDDQALILAAGAGRM